MTFILYFIIGFILGVIGLVFLPNEDGEDAFDRHIFFLFMMIIWPVVLVLAFIAGLIRGVWWVAEFVADYIRVSIVERLRR